MSGPATAVAATTQAIDLIEKLKRRFGPLMFVQSGGCCDGSAPMCFPEGEYLLGPHDLLLGSIADCSYYIDAELFERWGVRTSSSIVPLVAATRSRLKARWICGRSHQ
jgi:uncharacterized protein (DUF779 family)